MESPTPTDGEQINEITSELSYEEEQLQIIIMKELENQKIETERKIVQKQDAIIKILIKNKKPKKAKRS